MEKNFINISKLRTWRRPHYLSRLPNHYYKHRRQLELPTTTGYDKKQDTKLLDYDIVDKKSGRVERIPFTKIPVEYPVESDYGLWHGEGVVKGFTIPTKKIRELNEHLDAKVWFPKLIRCVFYSEILDDYFKVVITYRTKDAINEMFGFDNYILRTPVQDLKSQFGLQLRREMLIKLAKKDYYPNNTEKFKMIEEKYKDCVIPLEEAEWFGLPLKSAIFKQEMIEINNKKLAPLKIVYAKNLVKELTDLKESKDKDFEALQKDLKPGLFNRITSKLPFFNKKN